jgi:hypothetical protein
VGLVDVVDVADGRVCILLLIELGVFGGERVNLSAREVAVVGWSVTFVCQCLVCLRRRKLLKTHVMLCSVDSLL